MKKKKTNIYESMFFIAIVGAFAIGFVISLILVGTHRITFIEPKIINITDDMWIDFCEESGRCYSLLNCQNQYDKIYLCNGKGLS